MRHILIVAVLTIISGNSAYSQSKPSETPITDWTKVRDCTEFLPKRDSCKVAIPMGSVSKTPPRAPTQVDITLEPGGSATVVLTNASPLMSCALVSSPAVLTRDASTSITTFLTTIAGLGAVAANPAAAPSVEELFAAERLFPATSLPPSPAADDAKKIDNKLDSIANDSTTLRRQYQVAVGDYAAARVMVRDKWKYSYTDDADFAAAAMKLFADIRKALEDPLPTSDDEKGLTKSVEETDKGLREFKTKYSDQSGKLNPPDCKADPTCVQQFESWFEGAESQSGKLRSFITSFVAWLSVQVQVLSDTQTALKPAYTWLSWASTPPASGNFVPDAIHPWTTIALPMSRYAQKQVTEAITCKDILTQAQPFDSITFTAYYEIAPSWDLSAGAFISLIPGHQVGTVSGPLPAASTTLAVTNSSAIQFIPGAIFEVHPSSFHLNFVCPWARGEEGKGYHPWGFVCSFGPAVGFLINPNNGTTSAEFFEGVSFGIHRVAILVGNHTGRFQQFTGGYEIGQTVPSGTMAPTNRRWTNHPAFGISYRIPLR